LNSRKRGPNLSKPTRRSKTRSTSDRQEPRGRESDEDSSSDDTEAYERPVRTTVKGIKTELPGAFKPVPKTPPPVSAVQEVLHPAAVYLPRLGEGEFRIMLLAPGRKEDKVICSFLTTSISGPVEYEAISYLWGAGDQKSIEITLLDSLKNHYPIYIRSNLHSALRSLRHPKNYRQFWVDALCINRSNREETNRQVAMKRDIFHEAANLCFWLGEDASSKAALTFIPQILDLARVDKLVRDDKAIDGWVAFVALLKNTVFSRLWLVQEVAVAQNVTLHCGQPAIHYEDFVDAVAMFVSYRVDISLLFRRNQKNYKELTDRKMTMAEHFIDVTINALRVLRSGRIQRLLSLEALVSQLSDLTATNPRDRIFSVLALARDGPKNPYETRDEGALRIDYDKSILEIYQNFVIHVIKRSGSLDIICRRWASSVSESQSDLPTWVRPLHSSLQSPFDSNSSERTDADSLVGIPDRHYYNASGGTIAIVHTEPQPSLGNRASLFARGFRADTISKLGPRSSEGIILCEWLELGGCQTVGETVPEDFWRTLVADRGPNGSNVPSWYNRAFLYCLQQLTPNGDINTNRLISECEAESSLVVEFLERVQSVIWNRKFLVSKDNSWIGLAPMAAEVGDIICILYGCSVPVVLRPQSVDGKTFFHLVGECYVHGLMDGEVAETAVATGYVEREFELR
jgi:hypothetical protein